MLTREVVFEAYNVIPPILNGAGAKAKNRIGAIGTTTASARTDLSTLLTDWDDGHFITLMADGGDIYIALNNSNAGSIDETATGAGGATVCWKLASDQPVSVRLVKDYSWLIHKAAAGTPKLRVYLSSCVDADQVL